MQVDFHYYATYAMARCAGFEPSAAKIIATSAQFVDDNATPDFTAFDDASSLDVEATAHHAKDVSNLDEWDQRNVWVPFHFLPAGNGGAFTEKLICEKDSEIAQEMRDHHVQHVNKPYGLHLLGVMAHVYGDTFSHYGFSGISSRWNRVDNDSIEHRTKDDEVREYIGRKADNFIAKFGISLVQNIKAHIAEEAGALGHGPVLTYPDRPFLEWRFTYERDREGNGAWRNNRATFLEYCQKIHMKFCEAADLAPQYADLDARRSWGEVTGIVEQIIAFEGQCEKRCGAWQKAALDGDLFNVKEQIPPYMDWNHQRDELDALSSAAEARDSNLYHFYQAASYHRWYVLRELLPQHGIVVN